MSQINISPETEAILQARFGRDSLIALATCAQGMPYVRTVDSYYEDGAFYVLTYALSGKMRQIADNPIVALSGDWFTAHGRAVNLGWFGSAANRPIAARMRELFAAWIDNGHNNFEDRNTIILRIDLTDGLLLANGVRYELQHDREAI